MSDPLFIDMDGVLVDFIGGCARLTGRPAPKRDPKIKDNRTMEEWFGDDVWKRITIAGSDFWEGLEPFPWAAPLWERLCAANDNDVYILSSPGNGRTAQQACYGKIAWCRKHLGIDTDSIILAKSKSVVARPSVILIDDTDRILINWERSGGRGIVFPQPWNGMYQACGEDPIAYLQRHLQAEGVTL